MAPSHASLQALQKTQKTCIHHFLRCTSPPLKASTHSALKTVSFHCTGNHCNPLAIAIARQCVRPAARQGRTRPRLEDGLSKNRTCQANILYIHTRSEEHTSELQSQSNLVCR